MKTDQQVITELFFDGASLENLSVAQLKDFISSYPHSAAARILLLKKIRHDDPDLYKKQLFNTSIYLSNPLMLNQHLDLEQSEIPVSSFFVEAAIAENKDEEHPIAGDLASESVTQEFDIVEEADIEISELSDIPFVPELNRPEMNQPESFAVETDKPETHEEEGEFREPVEETAVPGKNSAEMNLPESFFTQQVVHETQEAESELAVPSEETFVPDLDNAPLDLQDDGVKQDVDESAALEPSVKQANSEFAFEAFHTVDYFASQGIRLRPSELGKDKLGQQLKSFTDWLRSMKRLPESGAEIPGDDSAQQTISIIAAHSLEEKEVITEAMAQVWAKQGNRQKAIAIYEKLSLQNPSKTPYFAAKIDQLNSL